MKYLFGFTFCVLVSLSFAQSIKGSWKGDLTLQPGTSLPVVFHIEPEGNGWKTTMDSPAQGAMGIPTDKTTLTDGELSVSIAALKVTYTGKWQGDSITGNFEQAGHMLPLVLKKSTAVALPQAPSAQMRNDLFTEQPVFLETGTGKIYGTLTLPKTNAKTPLVLFIAGSGPTDRNGNNTMGLKTNCTLQLAQALATAGIASVRYDKRGIGESRSAIKSEADARFEDYITDAKDWLELLKKDSRFSKIIIAGHSEGSLIGMVAARNLADRFISIAGAGESAPAILKTQFKQQLSPTLYPVAVACIDSLSSGHEVKEVPPDLSSFFRPSVQPYLISWFRYNPQTEIGKLKIPILLLQGAKDLQITVADAQHLKNAQPESKLIIIDKMNHVLKDIPGDQTKNMQSYGNPDLPVDTTLIKAMIDFIVK